MRYPEDASGIRRTLTPHYNRAGALERVELNGTTYVAHIAYNAKGQRTLIVYGNRVMTRYAYDPRTFRLVRMRTERFTPQPNTQYTYRPTKPADVLQELAYEYDLVSNITTIHDKTPDMAFRVLSLGRKRWIAALSTTPCPVWSRPPDASAMRRPLVRHGMTHPAVPM